MSTESSRVTDKWPLSSCSKSVDLEPGEELPEDRSRMTGLSLPVPTTSPKINELSTEILFDIISHLKDPPSVVCFALSNKRHRDTVHSYFNVNRLDQIVPKDIRAPLPTLLEPYAYNVIVLGDVIEQYSNDVYEHPVAFQHRVANYVPSPMEKSIHPESQKQQAEKLKIDTYSALLRRIAWVFDRKSPNGDLVTIPWSQYSLTTIENFLPLNSPPDAYHFISPDTAVGMASYLSDSNIQAPPVAAAYFDFCIGASGQLPNSLTHGGDWGLILDMWNQPIIESVEHLVLKELLKEWNGNQTGGISAWASFVNSVEFRVKLRENL